MGEWFVERVNLTSGQKRAIELPLDGHTLVLGPVGTGKTLVCCHRAAYVLDQAGGAPHTVRIFVPSDVNLAYMQAGLVSLRLDPAAADTMDHWCRGIYREHISETLPVVYLDGRVDDTKTRESVLELLRNRSDLCGRLTHVILDDAQEYSPTELHIVRMAAEKVHILLDPEPSFFGIGTPETVVREIFNVPARNGTVLNGDFRCPRSLATLASQWLDDRHSAEFLSRLQSGTEGEVPVFSLPENQQKELDLLADIIRLREHMGDRIGILVSQPRLVHRIAGGLAGRRVTVEKAVVADAQNVFHPPYDFGRKTAKITTFEMGRGLTFDVVLLPNLTEDAFTGLSGRQRRLYLFSGISRARKWVHLSAVSGLEFDEFRNIKKAAAEGHIILQ
jgi:superfamily I DNA/RNA helicase